ncbi:MAG: hypothetical protein DCC75_11300, partial [Proteobacteria bacterium]
VNREALASLSNNYSKAPIPAVRTIDLKDESISDALRSAALSDIELIKAASENVMKELGRFIWGSSLNPSRILSLLSSPKESQQAAHDVVREMLQEIAGRLSDPVLRDKYSRADLPERERLNVLGYCSKQDLSDFLRKVAQASHSNPHVREFMQGKFNNALQFASQTDKATLVRDLMDCCEGEIAAQDIVTVLRTIGSLDELVSIVNEAGDEDLLALGSAQVKEMVALARVAAAMRNIEEPATVIEGASCEELGAELDSIARSIEQRVAILNGFESFADTHTVADFLKTATYELDYLRSARERGLDQEQAFKLAELMREKLSIEFRFGMTLSHQGATPAVIVRGGEVELIELPERHWSIEELRQVRKTLENLPEGLILTTPLLREVQRVATLGYGVLGQRFPDGLIRIADFAVGNRWVERFFPGISSLQVTLTHEIGHGVQIADRPQSIEGDEQQGYKLSPGDSRYDFAEYMSLSGWSLIAPERFEITNEGLSVVLDGEEYPIGHPIKHNGNQIILVLNQGLLFSHQAYAPFSLIDYSRTNPWEDWAEAFAEYFLMPRRLVTFAPEKFRYFEEEFGVYRNSEELRHLLADKLKKRREDSGGTEAERFAANLMQ